MEVFVLKFNNYNNMKKYLFILFLVIFSNSNAQNNLKKDEISFKVAGNCEMCKMRIEKAALSLKGVKYANWSIPDNQIRLIYNPSRVELTEIHNSIANSGHDTSVKSAPTETYNELPICCLYVRENNQSPIKK